jgi:hypothetical protein
MPATGYCGELTIDQVVAMRLAGRTYAEIAAAAHVTVKAIWYPLSRRGLVGKHGGPREGEGWMQKHLATIPARSA